ncbi:helix-turn-helix domain-containing protein [Streptomyces zagrosensis]|uniref:Insertion element IS150 protein InsJ-like helix-turn-helix domain-containing protein n=1 Tax=Streptomyces zagrosensis TaxID=1042984 RepID=A0A7W9QG74_9ACTN|nr:helix-turn-helix domain-containing protein [Streptomyces zagrosensis]MBB5939531.1 hypothetical protein [Streptomyces zagrosensis]
MSDLVGDARHLSPSAQEVLRLRAVAALVAGREREDVAAFSGVSLKAVGGWWAKWQAGGREALVTRPRGKPVGVHQVLGQAELAAETHRFFRGVGVAQASRGALGVGYGFAGFGGVSEGCVCAGLCGGSERGGG